MENFDEKKSLEVISGMINMAKNEMKDNGTLYLLWGWSVFISAAAHYVLIRLEYEYDYLPWVIMMPLTGIVSAIYGLRSVKKTKVKTFMDTFMAYLWSGFAIVLIMVLGFMSKIGFERTYPILLMLYGLSTFVSGGALKFRPLIWGGVACWLCSIAAFFVPFDQQLILLATAVLLGYIVPGHILKANYYIERKTA